MDIQDMSDLEYQVFKSRELGAAMYRAAGFEWFARRVEQGLEDHCNPVRLGRFIHNLPDTGPGMMGK